MKYTRGAIPAGQPDHFTIVDDPLEVYFREVAKVPRLTPEDETRLAEIAANNESGADRARRQLVEANLWLVVEVARLSVPDLHNFLGALLVEQDGLKSKRQRNAGAFETALRRW